jgi:Mor family transcriptional regulator
MRQCKVNFVTREKIIEEYKNGTDATTLAEKYGCSFSSVYRFLREANVEIRHTKKDFDNELADTLRKEYEEGSTSTKLALKYDITKSKVCSYIREAGGTIRSRGPRGSYGPRKGVSA